jgi:hypothetical protein
MIPWPEVIRSGKMAMMGPAKPRSMLHAAEPFWTDLVWRAYESAPAGTDVFFHLGRRYVMPLLRYVVPIARIRGRTAADGRPGSILVAGSGAQLLYLRRRFFIDAEIENLGRCPVHALRRTLLAQGAEDDLIVARVARCLAGSISGGRFLRVPDLVAVWLDVRDRSQIERRMSQAMRHTDDAPRGDAPWVVANAGDRRHAAALTYATEIPPAAPAVNRHAMLTP